MVLSFVRFSTSHLELLFTFHDMFLPNVEISSILTGYYTVCCISTTHKEVDNVLLFNMRYCIITLIYMLQLFTLPTTRK